MTTLFSLKNELRDEYMKFINHCLPEAAKKNNWPISENHCFGRVILDFMYQDAWYKHLSSPGYKHLSEYQLIVACERMQQWLNNPQLLIKDNQKSLIYRNGNK